MGQATPGPLPAMYEPMLCFVLQGTKRVTVGNRTLHYEGGSYLIASADLPITGEIAAAGADRPYMAISLTLDPTAIGNLLLEMPPGDDGRLGFGIALSPLTLDLVDPMLRLLRLLDSPEDIPILASTIAREMLYRLLTGPHANMLRQVARTDSRLS